MALCASAEIGGTETEVEIVTENMNAVGIEIVTATVTTIVTEAVTGRKTGTCILKETVTETGTTTAVTVAVIGREKDMVIEIGGGVDHEAGVENDVIEKETVNLVLFPLIVRKGESC